MTPVIYSQG